MKEKMHKAHKKRYQGPASRMAQRRMELGLTQKQVADRVGICRVYITNIENNKRNLGSLSHSLVTSIARALECVPEDLLCS